MKPYHKITFFRNRHRARDLRMFRELVETYFDRAAPDADDVPFDWEGARDARSQINRMLPRVVDIVYAARLDRSTVDTTDPGPSVGDANVLRKIFSARYADGADQEILDVIDMALGVYEASRFGALARTFNPFHYALTTLGFAATLPRRALSAAGMWPSRSRVPRMRQADITRIEGVASRLADVEELIETKFAEMRERQAHQLSEYTSQVTELAERLDFTERVLAQNRTPNRLKGRSENDVVTPA